MIKRISKRLTKNKRKKQRSKKSTKSVGLIYYKMKNCKYCKIFEKELWPKIVNYCKKNNIKTYVVQRELYPELIPKIIKTYPSLMRYDNHYKVKVFNKKRNFSNIKRFLI